MTGLDILCIQEFKEIHAGNIAVEVSPGGYTVLWSLPTINSRRSMAFCFSSSTLIKWKLSGLNAVLAVVVYAGKDILLICGYFPQSSLGYCFTHVARSMILFPLVPRAFLSTMQCLSTEAD
mmetsp:Transcript_44861/g.81234  ORF Transcript_44861/g.81234 Transcript_44861/m.81234 type:complete len:121 (+) Transcript_44861:137-499(+)